MAVTPENNPAGIRPFGPMMGVYESTPATVPDGQVAMPAIDENRNLKVVVVSGGGGGGGSLGAEYNTTLPTYANEDPTVLQTDERGRLINTLGTQIAGERLSLDLLAVEQQFTYSRVTADTLVKTGPGFLHRLTFAQSDAAPTAGSITVYDNTAESGTIIYSETFTTDVFRGYTVTFNANFSTGLYVGFTTTNDIGVTVSYR